MALDRLVVANIGLVIRVVSQYRHAGPAWEDLVQEGSVGLVLAARRFDPDRGTRLATYARFWIRAYLLQHIINSHGAVRIATTQADRKIFFSLARTRRRLERDGEPVGNAELAAALAVDEGDIVRMTPRLVGRDRSIDEPLPGADGRGAPLTLVATDPSPEELAAAGEEMHTRKLHLGQALKGLDRRERMIVRERHLSDEPKTLRRLGALLKVSRERVRQLEMRALAKLRAAIEARIAGGLATPAPC